MSDEAGCCAQGANGRAVFKDGSAPYTWTADSTAHRQDFLYETLEFDSPILPSSGITGSIDQDVARAVKGPGMVKGRISFEVSPILLTRWLPRILRGSPSGTSYPLGDLDAVFGAIIDTVADPGLREYQNLRVDRAMFHGKGGDPGQTPPTITLTLDIVGETEDNTIASFPAVDIPTGATAQPYLMSDTAISINSVARDVNEWWLLIDNHRQPRWVNSLSPVSFCPTGRTIMLRLELAACDSEDLMTVPVAGYDGSLTLATTGMSTVFTFGKLVAPNATPHILGKTTINLEVQLLSLADIAHAEAALAVVHDATP